jgi:hypothetical protein
MHFLMYGTERFCILGFITILYISENCNCLGPIPTLWNA